MRIKSIKNVLNRKSRMHAKAFHQRIRSLRSSDPPAYWRTLNSNNRQKRHTVDAISHDPFVEHLEKLGNIPEEELLHTFDNETDIFVHDDLENDISAGEVLKCIKKLKNNKSCGYDGILNEFLKSSSKLLIAVTTLFNFVLYLKMVP